ncbi:penicillin acylase family protein [Blastococcus tunisiensis]|uniref:Acyl-homoserine lactone (AHL) acylase PvdQ n=1 Tax=Blastococcus tunisiensis TaxID=1798228 RepID=A0A1I2CQS2_9ACTN|nr:penicillin acylase family protein [Blastococcus sp. DSM 46838]SFE70080.1 Acyl-homoserine lactone (AHL) acylase PvdQ [Blastococcus sp. DSM 46838]
MRLPALPTAVVLVTGMAVAGLSTPAGAAPVDPPVHAEYGGVMNVLPPGQRGSMNLPGTVGAVLGDPLGRAAVDGRNAPENLADQLEMYDALNAADLSALTEENLPAYYKDAPLTIGDDEAVSVERPKDGVVIRRDGFGVPYIEGETREDAAWGSGYAGTQDRMFLMDVLRHVGAARAAEFLGPSPENVAMDQEQLRSAFYTEEEAAAQVQEVAARFGAEGQRLLAAADAFIAGINAAQEQMCPGLVLGPDCPAEYLALQRVPEPWDRADVVSIASLVGGIFGKGGGAEFANARWLQQLEAEFGPEEGRRVFDDLRSADDAHAPTTSSIATPYGGGPVDPTRPGVALPDLDGETAPGTGSDAGGGALPLPSLGSLSGRLDPAPMAVTTPFGTIDLAAVADGMSNAALVSGDRTADGHPVTVFGPQTGYYAPQLLTEQAVVAPGIRARGVSFAGTNLVVQLGRGVDYAWSATSSNSDNVDTVVVELCDPDGGPATVESEGYVRTSSADGERCVPMDRHVHEEIATPTLGGAGAPQVLRFLVLRTDHGIVQLRTTVDGEPVGIVTQRSTYHRELDSVIGFERFGNPDAVHDAASFQEAAAAIDYTFNWFYADDRDIAYYSSGRLPVRAEGTDPHLPRWADEAYDWQGWLGADEHPQEVNPPSGYLVSWNNKPAPGWAAADDGWGWGPVHRSLALSDRLDALTAPGEVTTVDLVAAVQDAATVDSRAVHTLPHLLATIGDDPALAEATALLSDWVARGGHRIDADRDGAYEDQAAIALFDAWWESAAADGSVRSVAHELLRGTLGDLVTELPQRLDDHPRQGLGSAWNNVAWYGYVAEDLGSEGDWSRSYCGGGDATRCRADLRASLATTVERVLEQQGVSSVGELGYDKHLDDIRAVATGVVGVRPIDWQNRPTFQQVVAFDGHRPR